MRKLFKYIKKCITDDTELVALVRKIDQTKSKKRVAELETKVARAV